MLKLLVTAVLLLAPNSAGATSRKKIVMDSHAFVTQDGPVKPGGHPAKGVWLYVNPNSHRCFVYVGKQLLKKGYFVSTANPAHPQPCGWGQTFDGQQWPAFSASPNERIKLIAAGLPTDCQPKDPANPFGSYRFRVGGWRYCFICLQGNNNPASIGFRNTNGCVMFGNADILALAELLHRHHQYPDRLRIYVAPIRMHLIPVS